MADMQNPWFQDPNNSTPPPAPGPQAGAIGQAPTPANQGMNQQQFDWAWGGVPQGATVTSNGPAWLQPTTMHNLSEALDPTQWQNWTPDQWRMWAGNAGGTAHNDVDTGLLASGMTQQQMNNYANTYGGTGTGNLGGRYDWATGKMVYDPNISATMMMAANNPGMSSGSMTGGVGESVLGANGVRVGANGQYSNWFKPFDDSRGDITFGNARPGSIPIGGRIGNNTGVIPNSPSSGGRPVDTIRAQLAREAYAIQQAQEAVAVKKQVGRPTTTRPAGNVSIPNILTPVYKRNID